MEATMTNVEKTILKVAEDKLKNKIEDIKDMPTKKKVVVGFATTIGLAIVKDALSSKKK
jgi:hypothetical protein